MKGILFDLDGTLLDTLDDLMDAVNYALAQYGYPARTREEIRQFVGNGAARLIQLSVPEGESWEPVYSVFQVYYREHCRIKTAPYPGVCDALRQLVSRYPVAIVSNKPDAATKKLCAEFFPNVYALGQSPDCARKPAPDMVHKAMRAIGVTECLYVGDSEVDIQTAANAGVPCLSVLWGFRNVEELRAAGGHRFCASPAELAAMAEELLIKFPCVTDTL